MAGLMVRNLESADEVRTAGKTRIEVVGDEPVVAFEFDSSTAQTFARPS
jgi:hypothetical protein